MQELFIDRDRDLIKSHYKVIEHAVKSIQKEICKDLMRLSSHSVTYWWMKLELYQKDIKWFASVQLLTSIEYITKIWGRKATDSNVQYSYVICTDLEGQKILELNYLTVLMMISVFMCDASLMYIPDYLSYLFIKDELNVHTWMQKINKDRNYLKIRSIFSAVIIALF